MLDDVFVDLIAQELSVEQAHARAALELLHGGARVPFVAHYRKDATGRIAESKLLVMSWRLVEYTAVSQRRDALLKTLEEKGWLTPALQEEIRACTDADALDDLYLPYKKHRGSKADIARERGLGPLAELIWVQDPSESDIEGRAKEFLNDARGLNSSKDAVDGALDILHERIVFDRELRGKIREAMESNAKLTAAQSAVAEGKRTKFESFAGFSEKLADIPSHRFLALMRGARQGMLRVELAVDDPSLIDAIVAKYLKEPGSAFEPYIRRAAGAAYIETLRPQCEERVIQGVRKVAEEHAIKVFCDNARGLYLQPAAGAICVLAVEAGLDDECAIALVDETGAMVAKANIQIAAEGYLESLAAQVRALLEGQAVHAFAASTNGTSRQIAFELREKLGDIEGNPFFVHVNASGLAGYAGSEAADKEFPGVPRPVRAAVCIARRLQNPLQELAKVDPRSIGVGQYHQDVTQKRLIEALKDVLESCVDLVGVDLNATDSGYLTHVSGLHADTAESVVEARTANELFKSLAQLNDVKGIGPKVFEQCAGFLLIRDGENPLDATFIHPEQYALVERIAVEAGTTVVELLGKESALEAISWEQYAGDAGGPMALDDIRRELMWPGVDPRRRFQAPDVHARAKTLEQVNVGDDVEGVITNVTDFGAFVDIGVRQDGLVHLSELAHHFVHDPHQVVRVGQYVRVKVLEVDKQNPRLSLSLKALRPGRPRKPQRRPKEESRPRDERPRTEGDNNRHRPKKAGKPKRPKREESRRQPKHAPERPAEKMNTQLADQLAALRDRLAAGGD